MEKWKLYAIASAFFAGITAILAKAGLKTLSADLALVVRTIFVLLFVAIPVLATSGLAGASLELRQAGMRAWGLLALSALATALSWVCYYRAVKEGAVSTVALIDKGSIVVTLVLAAFFFGEAFTWRMALGAALVVAGLLVLVPVK